MIGAAFVFAGCVVLVVACAAALLTRSVYVRLHFLTPVTSLAGPMIGIGLAIDQGVSLTSGLDLLIVGLLAATGPVLESATGRVAAQREGRVSSE